MNNEFKRKDAINLLKTGRITGEGGFNQRIEEWGERNSDFFFDLNGAELANTNLNDVDFKQVDLSSADLSRANLQRADFEAACLEKANLTHADLTDANLERAALCDATLQDTNCAQANFERADIRNADFSGAKLAGANFLRTNNENSDFSYATYDASTKLPEELIPKDHKMDLVKAESSKLASPEAGKPAASTEIPTGELLELSEPARGHHFTAKTNYNGIV